MVVCLLATNRQKKHKTLSEPWRLVKYFLESNRCNKGYRNQRGFALRFLWIVLVCYTLNDRCIYALSYKFNLVRFQVYFKNSYVSTSQIYTRVPNWKMITRQLLNINCKFNHTIHTNTLKYLYCQLRAANEISLNPGFSIDHIKRTHCYVDMYTNSFIYS